MPAENSFWYGKKKILEKKISVPMPFKQAVYL
jgi:hypothetical protein